MALDFSKFIIQPDFDLFSKLPEYSALGAKTAAAGTTGINKALMQIAKEDVESLLPKGLILEQAQKDEINGSLTNLKQTAASKLKAGADVSTVINDFYNGVNTLKTNNSKLNDLMVGTQMIEDRSKDTPGLIAKNVDKNYRATVLKNPDGTPKKILDIFSDGKNANEVLDQVLNGYDDNYDNGAIRDALTKSKGNAVQQTYTKRDKKGNETKIEMVSQVPSTAYRFEETPSGDQAVVDGKKVNFSDNKLTDIFRTVTGDKGTGVDIDVMRNDNLMSSYAKSYPGFDGYLKQETRKFIKESAKNGIQMMDQNGNIKPEYQQDIDKFQQAVTYNAFDDLAPIVGGFKTKGGLPGKGDVVSEKAPLPQHPSPTITITHQRETANKNIFYDALDNKDKDADGYISIKQQFAGINDGAGQNYGTYGDLTLGWGKDNNGNPSWMVRAYDADKKGDRGPLRTEMALRDFISSHPTTDPTKSDDAQFLNLKSWTDDRTPKSGRKSKY